MATPSGQRPRRSSSSSESGNWYRMTGVGIEFAVAIGMFAGIGWWLDGRFGTAPWGLLIGVFLGFAVGLYMVIRQAKRMFHD